MKMPDWEHFNARQIWEQLKRGRTYRAAFTSWHLKWTLTRQVKAMRKHRGWSQVELARRAGLSVRAVAAAESPVLHVWVTLNTLKKIAQAFDCALIVRFCSFGELLTGNFNSPPVIPQSFDEEHAAVKRSGGEW